MTSMTSGEIIAIITASASLIALIGREIRQTIREAKQDAKIDAAETKADVAHTQSTVNTQSITQIARDILPPGALRDVVQVKVAEEVAKAAAGAVLPLSPSIGGTVINVGEAAVSAASGVGTPLSAGVGGEGVGLDEITGQGRGGV